MSIGPWHPFWIGEPARQLYAALHRHTAAQASGGVVLVPPLLHEQPRCRRFITEVASAFAANGIAALRFDFYGTGDSAGRADEMQMASMHEDLSRACAALRSLTGVSKVAVMAWRAGALVAWDWLRQGGAACELILWEPIVDGREWLDALLSADAAERCSPERYTGQQPQFADASDGQLMGYPVPQVLRDAMATVSLAATTAPSGPLWLIDRVDVLDGRARLLAAMHTLPLPEDAPCFGDSTRIDESLFMSPRMNAFTDELARTMAGVN